MAPSTHQTIYEIVALACAFSYCIVGCIVVEICYLPWLGKSYTVLTLLVLVQPLVVWVLGCGIFALTSMSFNKGGFLYVIIMSWLHSSLVVQDLPRQDQCLDMSSLKLGLALLNVVMNIRGALDSCLPVVSAKSASLVTWLVFFQASIRISWGYSLHIKYQ